MADAAIEISGVSKRYRLGAAERATTFREAFRNSVSAPLSRFRRMTSGGGTEEFWALRDVGFEVGEGEVVGVIGRNGAGKSTLLKILSQITPPTAGEITLRGRVASLLEVGTGFHPELTGRENIYLNGAMLGMSRAEIRRNFDEIVAFSEVEKFLDTPVKRYSSGMYVRLAFAVAAHLDPEILIVDEVLAVGDAAFQRKCLGKMKQVSQGGGRTVLFVSHNMTTVQALCDRCVVLSGGKVVEFGPVRSAVKTYLSLAGGAGGDGVTSVGKYDFGERRNPYLAGRNLLRSATLYDELGQVSGEWRMGEPARVVISLADMKGLGDAQVAVIFKNRLEQWVANFNTGMKPPAGLEARGGWGGWRDGDELVLEIPRVPFTPGQYTLDVSVARKASGRVDAVENAITVEVLESDVYGSGYEIRSADGVVWLDAGWKVEEGRGARAEVRVEEGERRESGGVAG